MGKTGHRFPLSPEAQQCRAQVTAVRQNAWEKAHPMVVEVQKPARERGYYINPENPELFGAPAERGIEWSRNPQMMQRTKAMKEKQAIIAQK